MKPISFPAFFSWMLILSITIVACAGCTGTTRPAGEIVSGYKAHIAAVSDYSMEAVQTFSSGSSQDLEIHFKQPYQYLIRHEVSPGGRTWTVAVQNLTYTRYEPASRTADILPIHDPETCFPPIADPNRLAFPVLFSGAYSLSDAGVETIRGRDAYRIDAANSGPGNYFDEGLNGTVRIWIDRNSWLVTRIEARDSAGVLKNTFDVENFTPNTGIPDSEFTVAFPEGTKIVHPNQFC